MQAAWSNYWAAVNSTQQSYNQGGITNSQLQSQLTSAVKTRDAALATAKATAQATTQVARDTLRAAGDESTF